MTHIVRSRPFQQGGDQPHEDDPAVGKWYWVTYEDAENVAGRRLGCITHVGSNYAKLAGTGDREWTTRIHFDVFWSQCEYEPNPDAYIGEQIAAKQAEVRGLMAKVVELTSRLSLSPHTALPGAPEAQALALRSGEPVEAYKTALERAKDKDLPELFEAIRDANRDLGRWMTAKLIPMQAQADQFKPLLGAVKDRIFNVELYAGLIEQVVQIREGEPAPLETKVHLFQRRHYMDEECLAHYETGGMCFKQLNQFDAWLAKNANFNRILPFPRCIVAFQVRRREKERDWENIRDFFRILEEKDADKLTFLYIRNGEQLFRLSTGIDFGPQLFPDQTHDVLGTKIYARIDYDRVAETITEGAYQEKVAEEERAKAETSEDDAWRFETRFRSSANYEPFDPSSVFYDDILKHVQTEMATHNRLVLVLQGLLDRSPVLHPHPPWSLWNPASFLAALELVYDDSRTLTSGEKPDFEAYRAKCNASLKTGSITVGQEVAWERFEARKENDRRDRDYRTRRSDYRPSRHRPFGDPGPGLLARVFSYQRTKTCTFAWNRERQRSTTDGEKQLRKTFTCAATQLLNVDAYKPGDFKQFFADPRTREEYLQWAPLLLLAEEYHAGNIKVREIPEAPAPPKPTWEGQQRYAERKKRKELMGKAVRLTRDITMKSGTIHKEGSLWRVYDGRGNKISVEGIHEDGTWDRSGKFGDSRRAISNLDFRDVYIDPTIPGKPKATESSKPENEDDGEDDE